MKYQKNFLANVVLRLDFATLPALISDKRTPLSEGIKDRFPLVNAVQASTMEFTWGPEGSGFNQKGKGWVWHHTSDSGLKKVVMAADSLTVEYGAGVYVDFPEYFDNIQFVLREFYKHYAVPSFTRVGLRFIDSIDLGGGDPLDWNNIVSDDLVTAVRAGLVDGVNLTRSMHQLIASKDDISISFNYGISNPDFPSPPVKRFFVLDYDMSISGEVLSTDIERRVTDMNAIGESMFESSIQDGLRQIMGVINE